MKQNLLFLTFAVFFAIAGQAQTQCPTGVPFPKFNTTPTLVPGTGAAGTVGAVYKYTNVLTTPNVDAIVQIEAKVNATLVVIDNNAVNPDRFSPQIKPSPNLTNTTQEGYIQWKITFLTGGTNVPLNISQLDFTLYDIDGNGNNNNSTRYQETGWITGNVSGNINNPTELNIQNGVVDGGFTWTKINGSITEHPSVSSDPEVAAYAKFVNTPAVRFRQGYKYTHVSGGAFDTPDFREYASEFKCFIFPTPGPLPLIFKNFSVTEDAKKAILNWTSFNEIDVNKFEVERSDDGYNFKTVGIALSNGGPGQTTNYEFPDNLSLVSANAVFYRIKAVDKDEKARYSNVVSVKLTGKGKSAFTISPVPAKNNAVISFSTRENGNAFIRITDLSGKTVIAQDQKVIAGNNVISLHNLDRLVNGTYVVQIGLNSKVYNERLVIAR
jgi:Secretion system C-terminal sorting domain